MTKRKLAIDFRIIGQWPKEKGIEDLYDFMHAAASGIIGAGQEHAPMLFALDANGNLATALVAGISKDDLVQAMSDIARNPRTRCVVGILEAWASPVMKEGNVEAYPFVGRVNEDPNRREMLIFNVLTAGRQAMMHAEIDRTARTLSKPPFQWLDLSEAKASGRFVR